MKAAACFDFYRPHRFLPPAAQGMRGKTGLMQVSETLPPFTLRLSKVFVNGKQRIPQVFFGFYCFLLDLGRKWRFSRVSSLKRNGLTSK
jgi:hypothetical protein